MMSSCMIFRTSTSRTTAYLKRGTFRGLNNFQEIGTDCWSWSDACSVLHHFQGDFCLVPTSAINYSTSQEDLKHWRTIEGETYNPPAPMTSLNSTSNELIVHGLMSISTFRPLAVMRYRKLCEKKASSSLSAFLSSIRLLKVVIMAIALFFSVSVRDFVNSVECLFRIMTKVTNQGLLSEVADLPQVALIVNKEIADLLS